MSTVDRPRVRVRAWTRPLTAQIVRLPVTDRQDLPAEQLLVDAIEADLTGIVICGKMESGEEYFASSYHDHAQTLWLLVRLQRMIERIEIAPRNIRAVPAQVVPFPKG